MSCIIVNCCGSMIDLDFNCDDVVSIGCDWYHGECAVDSGKITQEQWESGDSEF